MARRRMCFERVSSSPLRLLPHCNSLTRYSSYVNFLALQIADTGTLGSIFRRPLYIPENIRKPPSPISFVQTVTMADVVMTDAPAKVAKASAVDSDGKKRFEVKKWNAVALWAWGKSFLPFDLRITKADPTHRHCCGQRMTICTITRICQSLT